MSELYNQRPYVGPILKKPRLNPCVSHLMPGTSHNDGGGGCNSAINSKRLLSFKEFILSQSNSINEQEALSKYVNYKADFTRRQIDEFFKEHHEDDWFRYKSQQPSLTSTATSVTTSTATALHPTNTTNTITTTTNSGSLFKDPSTILNPLSDDVTSMIKNEVHNHRALNHNYNNTNHGNEPPILTLRQTQTICEKLIREREQRLREEYDRILINKLAEQYDTFVKYTHDHIEKRYNESNSHESSYLS